MKTFPCIATILLTSLCLAENQGGGEYRLVWADEFEKAGRPDPGHWVFEKGFCRNMELQWYQEDNAFCENGKLVIEGRKEHRPNPTFVKGRKDWRTSREFIEYTSSSLTTKGKHSWKFGRFEIKARIKSSAGLWPAIWTLGVEGEWPGSGCPQGHCFPHPLRNRIRPRLSQNQKLISQANHTLQKSC
jgi:beta-glucanase (GH16 family)